MLAGACAAAATCSPRPAEPPRGADDERTLAAAERREHLDTLAREPMLVEHPSGALFVAAYNRVRPALWKSVDAARTWTRVDVGTAADGAVGNSDVDLAIAPDGTLYFASMTYDNVAHEGRQIAVGASRDGGATWRWTTVSRARFDDRPWIAVAPDGTAHLVWNDGRGVHHAHSGDRGATWTRRADVHERGGSSHLAVGPRGELAVRVTPGAASANVCDTGTELVAVSADGGATWTRHAAPGLPRADGCEQHPNDVPRWVDPIAWDAAGALYALWTDTIGVHVARSADRGATWAVRPVAPRARGGATAFFPYLAARGRGALAATWLASRGDTLRWHAAAIAFDGDTPRVRVSDALPLESWRGTPPSADAAGEYLAVRWLRDGSFAVVTPVQHAAAGRLGFTWWRFRPR